MYAGAIYDAIYLYAIALNETLAAGGDKKDGRAIVHRMLNKEFEGTCPVTQKSVVQKIGLYRGSIMQTMVSLRSLLIHCLFVLFADQMTGKI